MPYFLLLCTWKEYTGFNSQRCWRKSCSVLHTWKSHPQWERAGSSIRSLTLLPEAVIWHGSGYDSRFGDNTAHVPTPLSAPAVIHDNLYSHTVTGIKDGSCRKITWQKKCTWLFFYPNTNGLLQWFMAHLGEKTVKKTKQIKLVINTLLLQLQSKVPLCVLIYDFQLQGKFMWVEVVHCLSDRALYSQQE